MMGFGYHGDECEGGGLEGEWGGVDVVMIMSFRGDQCEKSGL